MNRSLATIIFLTAFIFGCSQRGASTLPPPSSAPGPQSPTLPAAPVATELSNKSLQEVLVTKYNKALFKCSLWIQSGANLNKSVAPDATVSWDLIHDYQEQKTLEMKYQGHTQSVDMKILITNVTIANGFFKNSDGHTYGFKNSPVVDFKYSYATVRLGANGLPNRDSGIGSSSVYEKIDRVIFDHAMPVLQLHSNDFISFDCTIESDIKPEYQDQFS